MTVLLAVDYVKLFYPQNMLAILGGAVLGFFLTGFITQAAVRATGGKVIPNVVLWVVRMLGALVAAWLVALFLLGPGGMGWSGGEGTGSGDMKDNQPSTRDAKPPEKDAQPPEKDRTSPTRGHTLFVEVLTNDEIRQAVGEDAVAEKRYYRDRNSGRPEALLTLRQVREKLENDKPPYDKLLIVLGKDRSDKEVPRVADLKAMADRLRIFSDYTAP
jgi:hypothetical protein